MRAGAALVLLAGLAIGIVLIASSGSNGPAPPTAASLLVVPARDTHSSPTSAEVTIRPGAQTSPIPHSFFGLSSEYWTPPKDERHVALYRRLLTYLHVPGDGPFVLRIGGDSSDHTFYDPTAAALPNWAFGINGEFVTETALVVREMNLRVILDLNLITGTSATAAGWARNAQKTMPPGSIIGYEIGNEPDLYSQSFWLNATDSDRFDDKVLPAAITPSSYVQDYKSYARAISRVAPGVPLYAPAVASTTALSWIAALLDSSHPGLRVVSAHRYPYSGCAFPGSPAFPTIERILSENASAGMAASVQPAVALARKAGLPMRLTEINSITCGGLTDVSNTFATALWAPDAIFELERTGLLGVNLHARVTTINGPFTYAEGGLLSRPLLYGLILFARTLGRNARLVPAALSSPAPPHLKVWAVKFDKDELHVLLLNKGPRAVTATLNLPATRPATVQRLLAPSVGSFSGETWGGQHLDASGNWVGKPVKEQVTPTQGRYTVTLEGFSAALLTLHVPPGALA